MLKHCEIAHIGIDPVIFSILEGKLVVYLNIREKEPDEGKYELPGGFVGVGEEVTDTLKRKLAQILGKRVFFTQFETFSGVNRDPRMRIISIGHIAIVKNSDFTTTDHWHKIDMLPKLAFDHKQIILQAKAYLQSHLHELLAQQFLPNEFAINKLQEVYEAITGETYDNRNFRRKMINTKVVIETGKLETNVSHRPAKLFKFTQ